MKKNLFFKLLMPIIAIVAFSNCQKEPSELVIDGEKAVRKATIIGTLNYSKGQNPTTFQEAIVPATGKKVFVDVPLSYYSGDGLAGATKRFETTVSADGTFTLEIPLTYAPLTNVKLEVENFTGMFNFFEQYEVSTLKPKFVEKEVLYTVTPVNIASLSNGKIESKNLMYAYNKIGYEPTFKYMAKLTFDCETPKEEYRKNAADEYEIDYKYAEAANVEVIVEVTHSSPAITQTFIAKSNSEGLVTINVPIKDGTEDVKVTVKSNPYNSTFKHYQLQTDITLVPNSFNLTGYFENYAPKIENVTTTLKIYNTTKLSNKFRLMFYPSPADQAGANDFDPTKYIN